MRSSFFAWWPTYVVICMVLGLLISHASLGGSHNSSADIVFFDPDVNYDALPNIIKDLNEHLAQTTSGMRLQAVDDISALVDSISNKKSLFALVNYSSLDKLRAYNVEPLLIPVASGTIFYHKFLVDTGNGQAGNLEHRRIAAATGDQGQGGNQKLLENLEHAGIQVKGAAVISTSKDFDALLGLTFGQADAALITSDSIEVLKSVNPAAAKGLRVLWKSGQLLRPLLISIQDKKFENQKIVVQAFTNMNQTVPGKQAMKFLGFERWIPYNAQFEGKVVEP